MMLYVEYNGRTICHTSPLRTLKMFFRIGRGAKLRIASGMTKRVVRPLKEKLKAVCARIAQRVGPIYFVFEAVGDNGILYRYICRHLKNAIWYFKRTKRLPKIKRNPNDRRFCNGHRV